MSPFAAARRAGALAVSGFMVLSSSLSAQGVELLIVDEAAAPRAWIGLNFHFDLEASEFAPQGISGVPDGGPSSVAGIQPGDTLVLVDGSRRVRASLERLSAELDPGESVRLMIRRDGELREFVVQAAQPPADVSFAPRAMIEITDIDSTARQIRTQADSIFAVSMAGRNFVLRSGRGVEVETARAPGSVGGRSIRVQAQPDVLRPPERYGVVARARTIDAELDSLLVSLRAPFVMRLDSTALLESGNAIVVGLAPRVGGTLRLGNRLVLGAPGTFLSGAQVETLNPELAAYFGDSEGVLVVEVHEGTPAQQVGLLGGDVITHVGATSITTTDELERALVAAAVERERGTLGIVRDGQFRRVPIPR